MKIPEELQEYKYNEIKYSNLLEELQNLTDMAEKTTTILSSIPKANGISDKVGDCSSLIVDLVLKMNSNLNDILMQKKHITNKLEKIKQPHQQLLYNKYVLNHSLSDICSIMNYSYTNIKKIHSEAIELYGKVILD